MSDPINTPDENVTAEDIKATASAKAEAFKGAAKEQFDRLSQQVSELNINQKLLLTGAAALAASIAVQIIARVKRSVRVEADTLIVVDASDVSPSADI